MDKGVHRAVLTTAPVLLALIGCAATADRERPELPEPLYEQMTESDLRLADVAIQRALEHGLSNSRHGWRNDVSGHWGEVRPVRTYRAKNGRYCRVYEETLHVGQRAETYEDKACRESAGVWRVVR